MALRFKKGLPLLTVPKIRLLVSGHQHEHSVFLSFSPKAKAEKSHRGGLPSAFIRYSSSTPKGMEVKCQCGTISFSTSNPSPLSVYHCHCIECQKQSSSAFGTSAIFPADGIFPLHPELKAKLRIWTRPSNEGRAMDCYFCGKCGVRVMHRIRDADGRERDTVSIKGGLVEGLNWKGAKHIYTRSAVVPIPHGVERCDGAPEEMEGRKEGKRKTDNT